MIRYRYGKVKRSRVWGLGALGALKGQRGGGDFGGRKEEGVRSRDQNRTR